jgi:superfamily II DNA or RNA helicase
MTQKAKITIHGSHSILTGEYDKIHIREVTSFPVQGYQFSQAYRKGRWDGRRHLLNRRSGAFPTGLVASVRAALEEDGVEVHVEDWRLEPTPTEAGFNLIGITFDPPYEYQLDACQKMVEAKQGIIKMATGSGKTEVACAVTQYLGLSTLFLVPTRELLYQSQKRFIKRLGLTESEVGIVGDGVWQTGSLVTIATIDTLESRLDSQECQDLLKSIDVLFLDECVDENAIISTETGYCLAKNVSLGSRVLTDRGYNNITRISKHTKKGVRIITEHGGYITCSEDHPMAVWRSEGITYVKAIDLLPSDLLLEGYKNINLDSVRNSSRRYIQGAFAGDGHWHSPNKVRWVYRKDTDWWETTFVEELKRAYPKAVIGISINNRGDHSLIVQDSELLEDLRMLGFYCRQRKSKELPFPPDGLGSFIGGLFDAEGYCTSSGAVAFQTTAEVSQRCFHRFLRDYGINASFVVCNKGNNSHNTGYRIYIPSEYVDRFFAITRPLMLRKRPNPIVGKRSFKSCGENILSRRILKELYIKGLNKTSLEELTGIDLHSKKISFHDLSIVCTKIVKDTNLFVSKIRRHSASKTLGKNLYTNSFTKDDLSILSSNLLSIVSPVLSLNKIEVNLRPRSIKHVEKLESINTVEFEVFDDHTFVADGLLTHNCHKVGSDTYFTIATLCSAYYRFGLSATPLDRSDGANLMLIAATGEMITDIRLKDLVDKGVCAKANIIFDKITEPVLKKKVQYSTAYKQGVSENPQLLKKVIEWTEVCVDQGLGVLILCEEIQHGRMIDDALWTETSKLIPHQFIHGTEDTNTRKAAIESFDKRNLPVLIASSILDEGVDIHSIDVLILAGSRKSKIKTLQRLGRGLRGEKLIVIEFGNFTHKYLLEHSYERLQDYKSEECFPIHYSSPDHDLIKRLWS